MAVSCLVGSAYAGWWVSEMDRRKSVEGEQRATCSYIEVGPQGIRNVVRRGDQYGQELSGDMDVTGLRGF